jgi:ABC-type Fe3+/spermidine/putrescine transport system ATPase subunit
MIRIENLSARFGSFWLRDISLTIKRGDFFLLLGPTGAGKSLLLETILGIKKPDAGRILLDGQDITCLPPEQRDIAYVPQDLGLFPNMSPLDNILFGARIRKIDGETIRRRLDYLTEHLNLGPVISRPSIFTLSGGEKQRIAFARAIITKPRVLFLDEPFSALDSYIKREVQFQLKRLQKTIDLTIFHVTHDQEEAFLMADYMAVMIGGAIEQHARPEQCYREPANETVASFLLMQNIFDAEILAIDPQRACFTCKARGLVFEVMNHNQLRVGDRVKLGIRPEEIVFISPAKPMKPEMQHNTFCVRVESLYNLGSRRLVRLVFKQDEAATLDATVHYRHGRGFDIAEGEETYIHLRPQSFCLLSGHACSCGQQRPATRSQGEGSGA